MEMKVLVAFWFLLGLALAENTLFEESAEHDPVNQNAKCSCGYTSKGSLIGRIVGGTDARVHEFPLIGALTYDDTPGSVFCGGTIITKRHVLSAAHCKPKNPRNVSVICAEHNIETKKDTSTVTIPVQQFIGHQYFNESGHTDNDIAVLLLAKTIPFGPTIGPACFPPAMFRVTGQTVRIIGWGTLYYDGPQARSLQKVDVQVQPLSYCTAVYRGVTRRQLCTYTSDQDACQGDSGGPVLLKNPKTDRYYVVGIISYAIGCAEPDTPAVNTNVMAYREWIMQTIQETDPTSSVCENNS